MTDRHTHQHNEDEIPEATGLYWDKPSFYFNDKIFIPRIGDEQKDNININAVSIRLDGRLNADLDWKQSKQEALEYSEKNLLHFWDLELGLPNQLSHPLLDQMQFKSLRLSLEYFRETLWKEYKEKTVGICLYKGSADFSLDFPWDKEQLSSLQAWIKQRFDTTAIFTQETHIQISHFAHLTKELLSDSKIGKHLLRLFCRDAMMAYLDMLIQGMPDRMQFFMHLDASNLDPLSYLQLMTKERYERFHLVMKNSPFQINDFIWDAGGFITMAEFSPEQKIGICLPSMELCRPSNYEGMDKVLQDLMERQIPFRVISEVHLTAEWDGLDYLIVVSRSVSKEGKRKLQGFCAAGGTVVKAGDHLKELFVNVPVPVPVPEKNTKS